MRAQFTLGADPEFFVARMADTETAVPICGLLGGTKAAPVPIPGLPPGFTMQEDGVAAEFNIPPARTAEDFTQSVVSAYSAVLAHLNRGRPKTPANRYVAYGSPHAVFDVTTVPPTALVLGCDPDYNAYAAGARNPAVTREQLRAADRPSAEHRMCGFHLHLGYRDALGYELPEFVVAQLMDVAVGLKATAVGPAQGLRRQLYGRPGCYRPKPYGIEYRVMDGRHVGNQTWAYEFAHSAMHMLTTMRNAGPTKLHSFWSEVPWDTVRTAIETDNAHMADALNRAMMEMLGRICRRNRE